MDILYSSSDSYAFLTGISILSLLENNRECDAIHIYIMDNHISDINKNKLIEVVKEYRRDISFVPMPDMKELTGQEIDTRRWNISTFGRLYMASALPETVHKVLNIDCDTIIVDMSNFGLYKAFDEQGIGYAKTAVGDKYVYEYMAKNGCRVGGEQSGHIIFSKYASTGDGILTSLKMKEVMLAKKKPMSELAAPLKIYPQVLENVRVTDKKAAQNDPVVQEAVSKVDEALGDTGRILVRESGTEPVVRVMVEAPDHDTCQKYVDEVVNVICEKGYKA